MHGTPAIRKRERKEKPREDGLSIRVRVAAVTVEARRAHS